MTTKLVIVVLVVFAITQQAMLGLMFELNTELQDQIMANLALTEAKCKR